MFWAYWTIDRALPLARGPAHFRYRPDKKKGLTLWTRLGRDRRGEVELSDKWYLSYYADVGRGGSDLTKQAVLGLNYRFDKVVASMGYRYLDYDLRGQLDDLTVKGPYAGVRFRF